MKKTHIILLSLMMALPAFAVVSSPYYDDSINLTDDGTVVETGLVVSRDGATRATPASRPVVRVSSRSGSRTTTPVNDASSTSRSMASRNAMVARSASNTSRGTVQRSAASRSATGALAARDATTTTTVMTASGGDRVTGNTGRVGIRAAGSAARSPSIASVSVSNSTTTIADSVKEATANMDSLAELSDYCKAQYTSCMDNFCNVLDDNQGRCSCSKNVKNYEKTEEALRNATEELQDVAQRIQYIGLTAEEINTLFTQTEAEIALQSTSDNTKIKNDLDRIKNMIVNVKTGSSSAAVTDTSGISLDFSNLLSFNIDSYGFDLSALFGSTTNTNTQSIGNQRGEALYKSAAARCKTAVLADCSAQGVDAAVIINAYDVEIDKQCIIYERALTDSNQQMVSTVRNAKTVLQKARLMVAQQKNQYDLRGCVSALDSCMQDDYVCGNDYGECLDPTGKYIVEGEVIVGSMPGEPGGEWDETQQKKRSDKGLYQVWNVGGATGTSNIWAPGITNNPNTYTIASYINATLKADKVKNNKAPKDISELLQTKIGWHDDTSGRNYGMCMSVLNKCQEYTYSKDGKYNFENQIIAEYMQRAFRQIKAAQDDVLSKYATNCLSDVTACLSQNNYQFSSASSSSGNNPSDIAIRACLPVINTCRSVTLGLDAADIDPANLKDVYVWLDAGIGTSYQSFCESTGGKWTPKTTADYDGVCTCPGTGVSTGTDGVQAASSDATTNKSCVCKDPSLTYNATQKKCVSSSAQ